MPLAIAVLMDPIDAIKVAKDSTFAMLLEAQRRGHRLFYLRQGDLAIRHGESWGRLAPVTVRDDPADWFTLESATWRRLDEMDVILERKDPPVDAQYQHDTLVLELTQQGTSGRRAPLLVNPPQALRDCNEKLYAMQFPQCCPPTLVARDADALRRFAAEHGEVVLKPLDGMGGRGIFRVRDGDTNLNSMLETLLGAEGRFVMAQKFIPAISAGDKRILLIDGEPVPYALARIPRQGEFRGNLASGGRGVGVPLSDRDRWIVEQVAPDLRRRGLLFVGLDVIGDWLTEINVTSPTCIRELDAQFGLNIAGQLFDVIEERVGDVRDPLKYRASRVSTSPATRPGAPGSNDLLSATFLFSLIVHGVLILGITFAIAKPEPRLPTLDVTLVNTANRQTPEHADFLAQASNAGGGASDKARLPSQPVSGLLPTAADGLAPRPLAPSAPAPSQASGPHRVTSAAASDFTVTSQDDRRQHQAAPRPEAKADLKRRMEMARLAAEIDAASKAYAKRPHKKFISANTREYAYAAYMRAWARKVERVGTLNFPDAARTGKLDGNLILTVDLNRDGSIHGIDIIQSSGRKVLDDAAIRIVRMAAPFPPIPRTGEKVDQLYITRTYQFLRGGRLKTH